MENLRNPAVLAVCVLLSWASPGQANVVSEWNALAVECIVTATPPAGAALRPV